MLSDDDLVIGGATYTIDAILYAVYLTSTLPDLGIHFDRKVPLEQIRPLHIIINGRSLSMSSCVHHPSKPERVICQNVGSFSIPPGEPITTALSAEPPATEEQLELERHAPTRTNSSTRHCGSPDLSGVNTMPDGDAKTKILDRLAESDAKGHWHCHGDLWHQHVDWRARHLSPHNVRATGDPVVPKTNKAPTAEQTAAGFTSGWHWHGDTHHAHASGVHPHVSASAVPDVTTDVFYHWHGTPPDGTYHSHSGGAVYHTH